MAGEWAALINVNAMQAAIVRDSAGPGAPDVI